jgi:hypothetical protein
MTFKNQLKKLAACSEAKKWVGNKTIEEAWRTCKNPEWMLWVLSQTDLDLIDTVCDIVEEVLPLLSKDSKLSCIAAISAARRRASKDELEHAYSSAMSAADAASHIDSWTSSYAIAAAANAASVAASFLDNTNPYPAACSVTSCAIYASSAAASVSRCTASAAASAFASAAASLTAVRTADDTDDFAATVYTDAETNERKKQCDIIREHFTIDQVREEFNKLVD